MYDTVVFPTDGRRSSERACDDAVELASTHGADLHVVHVVDEATLDVMDAADGGQDRDEIQEGLTREGERAVGTVAEIARDEGVDVETAVTRGDPDREIVGYADDVDADVIVMGTEERPSEYRDLLGSVTEKVLRASDRPVLVVKTSSEGHEDRRRE